MLFLLNYIIDWHKKRIQKFRNIFNSVCFQALPTTTQLSPAHSISHYAPRLMASLIHNLLQITARQNTHARANSIGGSECVCGMSCIILCSHVDEPPNEMNIWTLWQGTLSSIFLFLLNRGAEPELRAGETGSEWGSKGKRNCGKCTDIKRSRHAEAITWHNLINHLTMRGRALF